MIQTLSSINSHIILGSGADPFITTSNGSYYLIESEREIITIRQADSLDKLKKAAREIIWWENSDLHHTKQLWAPELHLIDGKWIILVSGSRGRNPSHRTIVLSSQTDSPMGPYKAEGKASDTDDCWSIDMTYLKNNNELYGVWSGWEHTKIRNRQNLYIAKMDSPWKVSGKRICISRPEYDWETSVSAINEGPQIVTKDGLLLGIIYSANASWSNEYTQGFLKYEEGDLLDTKSWHKLPEPVADMNMGHLSFFKNCQTGEDWVAYHEKTNSKYGWKDRVIKARPFTWNQSSLPNLRFSVSY